MMNKNLEINTKMDMGKMKTIKFENEWKYGDEKYGDDST